MVEISRWDLHVYKAQRKRNSFFLGTACYRPCDDFFREGLEDDQGELAHTLQVSCASGDCDFVCSQLVETDAESFLGQHFAYVLSFQCEGHFIEKMSRVDARRNTDLVLDGVEYEHYCV